MQLGIPFQSKISELREIRNSISKARMITSNSEDTINESEQNIIKKDLNEYEDLLEQLQGLLLLRKKEKE